MSTMVRELQPMTKLQSTACIRLRTFQTHIQFQRLLRFKLLPPNRYSASWCFAPPPLLGVSEGHLPTRIYGES